MNEFPMLDIGCGTSYEAHVRVDIERWSTLYRRPTMANVIASAEFLPFRDTSFNDVQLHHVIEHINNPIRAVREALRVGGRVVFSYPHRRDGLGLWAEFLECFVLLFQRREPLTFLYHTQKMFRWKERMLTHKWQINFRGQTQIYIRFGPFKIPIAYRKVLGETWLGKMPYRMVAQISEKGKTVSTFEVVGYGSMAQRFQEYLSAFTRELEMNKYSAGAAK